jgi:predicted phosphatase
MSKIPQIDSIAEMARFWDTHDLTEFEEELEEVREATFDREEQAVVRLRLDPEQAAALHRFATSKGVDDTDLVAEWVREKLQGS